MDSHRCPECGRAFDPEDSASFNSFRPLTSLHRAALAPTGWPTTAIVVLLCAWILYLAIHPGMYYPPLVFIVSILLCGAVGIVLACRGAFRGMVRPSSIPRRNFTGRDRLLCGITLLTCILVWFHVPLRVAFLFARPELDRVIADIQSGKLAVPIQPRRVGPYTVQSSRWYGKEDQTFFVIVGDGDGGGFAYSPASDRLFYNTGADGHLMGAWYWWIDD